MSTIIFPGRELKKGKDTLIKTPYIRFFNSPNDCTRSGLFCLIVPQIIDNSDNYDIMQVRR